MIPQGTGWQYLRALSLDAIPHGTRVYHTTAIPLHEWRTRGAFRVSTCSKKLIKLETVGPEIGGALLADGEHLLDHAAEQHAVVHDAVVAADWHSPAWTLVSLYYWAFFSVLALTRLTGRSVWFLDRGALSQLRTLAGAAEQPGAGALDLSLEGYLTGLTREVTLRPTGAQLHDAVWMAARRLVEGIFQHSDQNVNGLEYRLWWSLKRVADCWGADWPSKLRNIANYRPGSVYREVVRRERIDTMKHIRKSAPFVFEEIIEGLEDSAIAIRPKMQPMDEIMLSSRLLGLFSIALAAVAQTLHSDLIGRQSGDPRWSNLRAVFFADRCRTTSNSTWPFAD